MAISNIVCSWFSQFEGQFTVAKGDMVGSKLCQLWNQFTLAISDQVAFI